MHKRYKFRYRSELARKEQLRRRLQAQAIHHNRAGRARTQDHIIYPPAIEKTARFNIIKVKGSGAWRSWTPDAILRCGFKPGDVCGRNIAAEVDGSHAHSRKCKQLVARVVIDGQQAGLRKLKTRASQPGHELKFYIVNTMFDETRLPMTVEYKGRKKHRIYPVLSSHQQVYWSDGILHEEDLIRRPVALRRATASCMWSALQGPPDGPAEGEAFFPPRSLSGPHAFRAGVLLSSDGHGTNHLLAKHGAAIVPDDTSVLASFCAQHRTGRVIEEISKRLGVVGPCYCMARLFAYGDFWEDIRDSLELYLSHPRHGLEVVATFSERAGPRFEELLMERLFVKGFDDDSHASANRRSLSRQVLNFPWALERGACRSRVPSRMLWARASRRPW